MSEWISVDDRLPEEGRDVLVYAKGGWMAVRHYRAPQGNSFSGWYPNGLPIENTTHWMPLPEPPSLENELANERQEGMRSLVRELITIRPSIQHDIAVVSGGIRIRHLFVSWDVVTDTRLHKKYAKYIDERLKFV
jgi:hypothetical protein